MRQVFIGAGKNMFDRLDTGSAQTYYWLVGLREGNRRTAGLLLLYLRGTTRYVYRKSAFCVILSELTSPTCGS